MKIYAIGDLHLKGGTDKTMEIFGENWEDHSRKIEENWRKKIDNEDMVLIPGDISWAMNLEDAVEDLNWLGNLPGRKVLIRGNHDFWWKSISQIRKVLHPSIQLVQNNSVNHNGIVVAGTRLWNNPELNFDGEIDWKPRESFGLAPERKRRESDEKVLDRELERLKLSLQTVPSKREKLIVMLHFPPTDFSFQFTGAMEILHNYGTDICVFGHLHTLKNELVPDWPVTEMGVKFYLVSSDFINFDPVRVM
ncbi:MAG: metallophosphoesterase [Vulcanimicrobiota bacterium]